MYVTCSTMHDNTALLPSLLHEVYRIVEVDAEIAVLCNQYSKLHTFIVVYISRPLLVMGDQAARKSVLVTVFQSFVKSLFTNQVYYCFTVRRSAI